MTTHRLDEPEVLDLERDYLSEAVGVLARGMRDNPMHVAAFGEEPEERQGIGSRLLTEPCGASTPKTGGRLLRDRQARERRLLSATGL